MKPIQSFYQVTEVKGDQRPGLPASGKLGFAFSGYIHDVGTSYSIWGGYHIYYTVNASPRGPMSDVARNPTTHQPSRDIRISSYENRRDTMRCTYPFCLKVADIQELIWDEVKRSGHNLGLGEPLGK